MNWRNKMFNKKYHLLLLMILISVSLIGCTENKEGHTDEHNNEHSDIITLSRESISQIKLETVAVSLQPFSGFLTIPAEVITDQDNEAQIGSLIQGRVHKVFVKVGDYVKNGQLLMTVEGIDVGEIKADYLKAKANYEYAKANYERQKKLFDEKIGSQKSLLESQAEYEKASAEYKAEDRKIHSVGLSDEDVANGKDGDEHTAGTLPIKSMINGVVVERNVVIGQLVDATTTAFKIINTGTVWVDGQIYEKDLDKIKQNTKAVFTASTNQDIKFEGKIIYVGQTVNDKTRTILIRCEFVNPGNKLKPQMYGELKIPMGSKANAILVPEQSVIKEAGQNYLFVQTSDSTFERRDIVIGLTADNLIEVKEGIKEGEKIVSNGVFYLKSGLKKDELGEDEH
jgi:cobalt-zinc-cadmium efflux system membrane fusion protein